MEASDPDEPSEKGARIHQPHDKIFKIAFSDVESALRYLKWRLDPRLSGVTEWGSLKLESGTFIDSHLRNSETDLLFTARVEGEPVGFYFLVEHLSSPDEFVALKLLRYKARIYERQAAEGNRLSPVFAFVVAQNPPPARNLPRLFDLFDLPGSESFREPFRRCIPDFDFDVLQLSETPYDEFEGTPAGILALRLLKAERNRELLGDAVWDEALILRAPREFFEAMLRYVLVRDVDTGAFVDKVNSLDASLKTTAMTLAEKFIQEGRKEGRKEGRQDDILDALELRFGDLPKGLVEEVKTVVDEEKLSSLFHAAIRSGDLEEFSEAL